jgi:energy-coupling factor transporter ATP-binding protein EcfA2
MADTANASEADETPLIDQILAWSQASLPLWQQDALRRQAQAESGLTEADYATLHHLLKVHHGAAAADGLLPKPWCQNDVPSLASRTDHATLLAIRDLQYVNRLVPGTTLAFAPQGLTVIYGGNGSGKSGFSRVLKRACKARDQGETIYPNATDPQAAGKTASATFDVAVGGIPRLILWTAATASPAELGTIAVFDTRCARAYLTTEGDIAYVPYGLDMVEDLADKVIPKLASLLEAEIASIVRDDSVVVALQGATKVGAFVGALNSKTNPADVIALATLSATEQEQLLQLEGILATTDPVKGADRLTLESRRFDSLVQRIDTAARVVDVAAISALKRLDD